MKIQVRLNDKGLVQAVEKVEGLDWIEQAQQGGKPPVLPNAFLSLVNKYDKGKPVSSDTKVIPISGQQWHNLTQNEKEELLALVEFTGIRAEDYIRKFQAMLPKNPRGK